MTESNQRLEEQVAHLTKTVDELNDVVAAQARDLALLKRQMGMLMEREAEREYASGGQIPLADQKPPHW